MNITKHPLRARLRSLAWWSGHDIDGDESTPDMAWDRMTDSTTPTTPKRDEPTYAVGDTVGSYRWTGKHWIPAQRRPSTPQRSHDEPTTWRSHWWIALVVALALFVLSIAGSELL